jgi:ComF family protein
VTERVFDMARSRSTPFARASQALLALLAPDRCAACGSRLDVPSCFCEACGEPEPVFDDALDGIPVFTAGRYAPPLSKAIGRLKFEGRSELASTLAPLLVARLTPLALSKHDCFVPVPLHPSRIVERGYNQAALLANALARTANARSAPRALARSKQTEQQARLGRDARRANVESAFHVDVPIPDGRVLLVDDVITTGETARACIAALMRPRCDVVAIVALARAGQRSDILSFDSFGATDGDDGQGRHQPLVVDGRMRRGSHR